MSGPSFPTIDLSAGWEFAQGSVGSRWFDEDRGPVTARVDLPHCWNTRDTQPEDHGYYRGFGNYRREFELTPTDPGLLWFLEAGGFYGLADVRLDGIACGRIDGQYLGFRLDVTDRLAVLRGAHRLGIRLTNRCPQHVLPGIEVPDFILYGGLATSLRLISRPRVRLHEDHLLIRSRLEESGLGTVEVGAEVVNRSSREWRGRIHWEMRAADGTVVAQAESGGLMVPAGAGIPVTNRLTIESPAIWGLRAPVFYAVAIHLFEGENRIDQAERRIGFRRAEFRPNRGFFLNGERVELRGCNRHENGWGLGNALPAELHRRDAELFRDLGLNFVRLSHYPQSPAFLDACDELGILVYAEIATWKSVQGGRRWLNAALRQLEGMILRDRHHPSVILWGLGNESRSRKAFLALGARSHELDPDRPTIYAENHFHRAERARTTGLTDVWGINYELDVREKPIAAARLKTAVVTECANYPHSRRGDFIAERRQVEIIKHDMVKLLHRPAIAGFALWCFADYATLRKARYYRSCGMVDGNRLPKMAAHWLSAMYADTPVVELVGPWRAGVGDHLCEIHLFTNAVRVEVRVDGQEIQIFEGGPHHVFSRKFIPGILVARAVFGDGTVRETCLTPWGVPVRLSIRPAFPESAGERMARCRVVDIQVEDAEGRRVCDWNQPLSVWVIGSATVAVSNRANRLEMGGGCGRLVITLDGPVRPLVLRVEDPQGTLNATVVLNEEGRPDSSREFKWPEVGDRPSYPPEKRMGSWENCDYQLIFLPPRVPRIRRTWLNEHRAMTRLGGAGGAPLPRGISVARDKGGFVVLLLRESIAGVSRLPTEVTPEEAAQWGTQVAAIHTKGILLHRLEGKDWVWEPGQLPRWRETGAARICRTPGWFFRWRAGREVGRLDAAWFAGREAHRAAFWGRYQKDLKTPAGSARWVQWGRLFQRLLQRIGLD